MICYKCKTQIADSLNICPVCGANIGLMRISDEELFHLKKKPKNSKKPLITVLLVLVVLGAVLFAAWRIRGLDKTPDKSAQEAASEISEGAGSALVDNGDVSQDNTGTAAEQPAEPEVPKETYLLLNSVQTMPDGSVLKQISRDYDASGNLMRENETDADGNLTLVLELSCDEFGRPIQASAQDSEGNVMGWYNYEYDEAGRLARKIYYEGAEITEGVESSSVESYVYSEDGSSAVRTYQAGTQADVTNIDYEYDASGNVITEVYVDGEGNMELRIDNQYVSLTEYLEGQTNG